MSDAQLVRHCLVTGTTTVRLGGAEQGKASMTRGRRPSDMAPAVETYRGEGIAYEQSTVPIDCVPKWGALPKGGAAMEAEVAYRIAFVGALKRLYAERGCAGKVSRRVVA